MTARSKIIVESSSRFRRSEPTLSDTESVPLLREVGDVSREIRGDHMVRTLVDLAARGERVLAVW